MTTKVRGRTIVDGWYGALALALVVVLGVLVFNRRIRVSLTAPRIPEQGVPDGLPWRQVAVPTLRGKSLFGWFISAGEGAPALAVVHGWGGNAEMMLPLARPLHAAGYSLLLFDSRSHGQSDGDSFSSLPRFAEDLEQAVLWLQQQDGVDAQRIGVVGHSVGAGAALLLAARRKDLAAVVSLAAFAHPARIMRRWLKERRIPFWPLGAYVLFYIQQVIGHRFDDIASCHTISQANCPVLLAHGTEDEIVPVSEAQEIYSHRRSEQVQLLLMPGSHDEYSEMERYIGTVISFLDAAMCRKGGA